MSSQIKLTVLLAVLIVSVNPALAKPKDSVVVEVVNIAEALSHSPSFHPAVPDVSTTTCTPNRDQCITTTVPGRRASIDNIAYYSQFLYVVTPNGEHFMLRHTGFSVVSPPEPGKYTAEIDPDKWIFLHVIYANGKYGKLKYHIEGVWPGI